MSADSNARTIEPSTLSSGSTSGRGHGGLALGLRILCHPDLSRLDETALLFDAEGEASARVQRLEPCFRDAVGHPTKPLESARVSRRPLVMVKRASGVHLSADEAGSVWVDEQLLSGERVLSPAEVERGVSIRLGGYVLLWFGPIAVLPESSQVSELRGQSRPMRELRAEIARVADLSISVLLRGETGVGKELVATALHRCSPRHQGPLVSVNMAAVPASMAASELFGHVKGAFTGAHGARRGYFAEADHGTLFLDEIGETASDVQPMLLRALEQGVIQPLGGRPEQVDVRLVAATDSNLEAAVAEGRFKAPLLRRFGYEIRVPALRERREDIASLFVAFLRQELEALGEAHHLEPEPREGAPWLRADFIACLVSHAWPGNVRELRNAARRFALQQRGRERPSAAADLLALLGVSSIGPASSQSGTEPPKAARSAATPSDADIAQALARNAYMVDKTAIELGVSRSWLHKHMNERPSFRKAKDLSDAEISAAMNNHPGDLDAAALELCVSPRGLRLRLSGNGTLPPKD